MPILSRRILDTMNKRGPITDNKGEIELAHTRAHHAIRHPSDKKGLSPRTSAAAHETP